MATYILELPYKKPPLTSNNRYHYRKEARIVKQIRTCAFWLTKQQRIPKCDHIRVRLHYAPATVRTREALNLVPTHKAAQDGIIDALDYFPDDSPQYVTETVPMIHPADKKAGGRMWIEIDTFTG